MFEMDSDPEVHKYLYNKPYTNIEQSREGILLIQKQYKDTGGFGRLAIILKETNEFVGWAGIKIEHNINGHESFHDLGYRLLKKHWNKGYASESSRALIDYGFKILNLNEICAFAFTKHVVSCKILEKIGFKIIGDTFLDDGDDNYWFVYNRNDYILNQSNI
jgi:RimJ/RimL family protein N-acetyltransferase